METKICSNSLNIIWRDEDFLIVDKPHNVLVHPSVDRKRPDIQSQIQAEFPEARLLHRLDFGTSGILVFGFTKAAQQLFDQADKFYLCVIEGHLASQGRIKLYLKEKQRRMQAVRSGGKVAITEFNTLCKTPGYSLLKAQLITGRRHQIRVSLAENKCPIIGDSLYGGKCYERLMLHAAVVSLKGRAIFSSIPNLFKRKFPEFDFDSNWWFSAGK
tara:strand:+ start:95 stop:739 length:645 start_codon:yes stop_codon:yes gene_type:complete